MSRPYGKMSIRAVLQPWGRSIVRAAAAIGEAMP